MFQLSLLHRRWSNWVKRRAWTSDYLRCWQCPPPILRSHLWYRTARWNKGTTFPLWTGCVKGLVYWRGKILALCLFLTSHRLIMFTCALLFSDPPLLFSSRRGSFGIYLENINKGLKCCFQTVTILWSLYQNSSFSMLSLQTLLVNKSTNSN